MRTINKNSIPINFEWFSNKLSSDFELTLGDKSKVIFGFNGIGKSTLCDVLKSLNLPNVDFLNYDQSENSLIDKTEIKLSYQIEAISTLEKEILEINNKLQFASLIKSNGLTNKKIRKEVGNDLEVFYTSNKFPNFKSSKVEVNNFYKKYPDLDMKNFFTFSENYSKINKAEEELEKDNKQNLYKALELIKSSINQEQNECPVCGTITDWQKSLDEKMKKLSNIKSDFIEKCKSKGLSITIEKLNKTLEAFKELKNNPNLFFDVAIANSSEEYIRIEKLLRDLEDKNNIKKSLLSEAKLKFDLVLKKKEHLENDLIRYFNIDSKDIQYNHNDYAIIIKFPREIKTYSTGEINLITFLYGIYSFLGSDKDTLVLDDPVSSLDIINQYKIAFEIVNNISNDKFILVLTHSTDFLNIINSQFPKKFDFLYLEQSKKNIYLDKIDYLHTNNNPNIITLDKIKKHDDKEGLIDYLKTRDTIENTDFEVLHYSKEEHYINNDKNKLSNYKLINLIDEFKTSKHEDFYKNSYNKIKYLVAIRVWVEKKLYETIDSTDLNKQKDYFKQHTLESRISYIMSKNGNIKINDKCITREQLMCKKVMLNQGIHFNSQIAPFSYAINLSLDDLEKEINNIKDLLDVK